jgi:hypothetical protein
MCYGNLDPKLAMRETEARVQRAWGSAPASDPTDAAPAIGLRPWLRAALMRLLRKDPAHV